MTITFWVLVVITGALSAYTGKYQAVTLWAGKMIAPAGMEAQTPTGFQDAITPKAQDTRNTFQTVLYLAVLVLGSFLHWYLGIGGVIVSIFVNAIMGRFFPQTVDAYLLSIIHALNNRAADYKKENDEMRADAAIEMSNLVQKLYMDVQGKGMLIPDLAESKKMENKG